MIFNNDKDFYYQYELPLAAAFYEIDRRGMLIDVEKLKCLSDDINRLIQVELDEISSNIGVTAVAKQDKVKRGQNVVNINSPRQLGKIITEKFKLKLPTSRKTHNSTVDESSLLELFAKSQEPFLQRVLRIRELSALKRFVNVKLVDGFFYTTFSVAGTVSGRRSARKSFCNVGGNGQNQPKHGDLAKRLRECFISRPGKVLISFDQVSAEDWLVTAIIADVSGITRCFDELKSGIDRHAKLASKLFNKPISECGKDASGSDTVERFMGKKTRHAGHYGEQEETMSIDMAKHGYPFPPSICRQMLERFHQEEPEIRSVFQKYVENEILTKKELTTPVGRHRIFFGIRPGGIAQNAKTIREAYSYIPQSTVGDNTGLAILELSRIGVNVLLDIHDAVVVECDNNVEEIYSTCNKIVKAFDRKFTMPNGFTFSIPVEGQIGFNMKNMKSMKAISRDIITTTLDNLSNNKNSPNNDKAERQESVVNCGGTIGAKLD